MLKREELTAERIEQIVQDARKAGYDFFLSAEQRAASLRQAMTRYAPGDEAWVFAYGSLMWNPALDFAESSTCLVQGWHRSFRFRIGPPADYRSGAAADNPAPAQSPRFRKGVSSAANSPR